jgi:hypothetical protein
MLTCFSPTLFWPLSAIKDKDHVTGQQNEVDEAAEGVGAGAAEVDQGDEEGGDEEDLGRFQAHLDAEAGKVAEGEDGGDSEADGGEGGTKGDVDGALQLLAMAAWGAARASGASTRVVTRKPAKAWGGTGPADPELDHYGELLGKPRVQARTVLAMPSQRVFSSPQTEEGCRGGVEAGLDMGMDGGWAGRWLRRFLIEGRSRGRASDGRGCEGPKNVQKTGSGRSMLTLWLGRAAERLMGTGRGTHHRPFWIPQRLGWACSEFMMANVLPGFLLLASVLWV